MVLYVETPNVSFHTANTNQLMSEALAIREGRLAAQRRGWSNGEIELDLKLIIEALNYKTLCHWSVKSIVADILALKPFFPH